MNRYIYIYNIIRYEHWKRLLLLMAMFNVQCSMFNVYAQITIGGNIYGGGNKGALFGNTNIEVNDGVIMGNTAYNAALPGAKNEGDEAEEAVYVYRYVKLATGTNLGTDPQYYTRSGSGTDADPYIYEEATGTAVEGTSYFIKTLERPEVLHTAFTAQIYNASLPGAMGGSVFGGARMADVGGTTNVTINGGRVLNVYGGNDISGVIGSVRSRAVTASANINIFHSIIGDVYGAGNGSYAYRDLPLTPEKETALRSTLSGLGYSAEAIENIVSEQKDITYDPSKGTTSLDALNDFRPQVPSVSILLRGKVGTPISINGSVYCGGNSATVQNAATLTIGINVRARNLFLGCNGANMVTESMLDSFDDETISSIRLEEGDNMAKYMKAVEMDFLSDLVFENEVSATFNETSTPHLGSFYCGGNVGSITKAGTLSYSFPKAVLIHEKLVGGCNTAFVPAKADRNKKYEGGMIGASGDGDVKIHLTLDNLRLEPRKQAFDDTTLQLGPYTFTGIACIDEDGNPDTWTYQGESITTYNSDYYMSNGDGDPETDDGSLKWGNVYGGCFSSGIINGDVVIDVEAATYDEATLFRQEDENGAITTMNSGVDLFHQSQDVFCKSLTIFGGGYGEESTIKGNTTININGETTIDENGKYQTIGGKVFQVFGGGEKGDVTGNATINLNGGNCREIYGGGFQGNVSKNTTVNLNSGQFYDAFGGACNALVEGYAQVIVGKDGSPLRGYNVYGGNDFGGNVGKEGSEAGPHTTNGYKFNESTKEKDDDEISSNTYVAYYHGCVDSIAAGNYGNYDYEGKYHRIGQELGKTYVKPHIDKSFLHILTPKKLLTDNVKYFLGGSEGAGGEVDNDKMQCDTYVLVDAPHLDMQATNVYGAGAHAGLRGGETQVWLLQGRLKNAFGASLNEGGTEKANVYVPKGSTIQLNAIFGGADGSLFREPGETDEEFAEREAEFNANINRIPCDAKYATIEFHSDKASVTEAIYGGNNFQRRTVYSKVNISVPVKSVGTVPEGDKLENYLVDVFGAGLGTNSWAACTKVNLQDGAYVHNVYGGGSDGKVFDQYSEHERLMVNYEKRNDGVSASDTNWLDDPAQDAKYTTAPEDAASYAGKGNEKYWLENQEHIEDTNYPADDDDPAAEGSKYKRWKWEAGDYNTNVIINAGAWVMNNAFAGGKGSDATVSGKTGLRLEGGNVINYIYGGGEQAFVSDRYELERLQTLYPDVEDYKKYKAIAQTHVHIQGGMVRGVYGGGLQGNVGCQEHYDPRTGTETEGPDGKKHLGAPVTQATASSLPPNGADYTPFFVLDGYTNVIIGTRDQANRTHENGNPEIRRSVYGGGEKGAVWGKSNLIINNGYVGYEYAKPQLVSGVYTWDVDSIDVNTPIALYHSDMTPMVYGPDRTTAIRELPVGEPIYGEDFEKDGQTCKTLIGFYSVNYLGMNGAFLEENGNAFGAGYGEGATVDESTVTMFGGYVRNGLYGGGEIAAVGHGATTEVEGSSIRNLRYIEMPGATHITMYNGRVCRNIFGGGRGFSYDENGNEIIGREFYTNGYVFGKCEVFIHGGEVGSENGVARGYGNVFGGGNIGYVYSGLGKPDKTKDTGSPGNYYYYYEGTGYKTTAGYTSGTQKEYHAASIISKDTYDGLDAEYKTEEYWKLLSAEFRCTEAISYTPEGGSPVSYSVDQIISLAVYNSLPAAEKAKCELISGEYKCQQNNGDYKQADFQDEAFYNSLTYKYASYWTKVGTNNYECNTTHMYDTQVKYDAGTIITEAEYNNIPAADKSNWTKEENAKLLTEDCKVVIEPYAQVKADAELVDGKYAVKIGDNEYSRNAYVSIDDLNMLQGKTEDAEIWNKLDNKGILIRNGVFAGGNVAIGSDKIFANAHTVFGNVTATVRDVYRRDLITIGTEHTGGLYGDGNLSLVEGYRELHIANYGTDYYSLQQVISLDEYHSLSDRERAYFRLRFKALKNIPQYEDPNTGVIFPSIPKDQQIYEDEYKELPRAQQNADDHMDYWETDGFCSIYAGRLLNTLQRADFVGIFGSRLVLQGAEDRVVDKADNTRYTINRVGEMSLNAMDSPLPRSEVDEANQKHGNYFGIYSLVNYLGNLTSDVLLDDIRTSDVPIDPIEDGDAKTYLAWKKKYHDKRKRNNGTCHNEVALASGVYLELTTEKSTANKKVYGYITGVVELDLINAKADEVGGGYVYAKNEHHTRTYHPYRRNVYLSTYNSSARTYKRYDYDTQNDAAHLEEIEMSGNFINDSRKTIIDDCYPNNAEYNPDGERYSEAHYWYVKGTIYVYDQKISAYTGSATAYSKEVKIPLTIAASSHGKLKLINVQPNLYAYYDKNMKKLGSDGADEEVKVNNGANTYVLNDTISYWDYTRLTEVEQHYFVPETMVSITAYSLRDPNEPGATAEQKVEYPAGTVMLPDDFDKAGSTDDLLGKAHVGSVPDIDEHGTQKKDPETGDLLFKEVIQLWDVNRGVYAPADSIIRSSNNMSHETGYVLTFDMDTPPVWDDRYTKRTDATHAKANIITTADYNAGIENGTINKDDYRPGPTFYPTTTKSYGQKHYDKGNLVPYVEYINYQSSGFDTGSTAADQATVSEAWATTEKIDYEGGTINTGSPISNTRKNELVTSGVDASKFARAIMCTETIILSAEKTFYRGEVATRAQLQAMKAIYEETFKANYLKEYMLEHELDPNIPEQVAAAEAAAGSAAAAAAREDADFVFGTLSDDNPESFGKNVQQAYYCETAGLYGGQSYNANTNYEALESWCTLSLKDRIDEDGNDIFKFNYDAFDLLADPYFYGRTSEGLNDKEELWRYGNNDNPDDESSLAPYCKEQSVEYTATYVGSTTYNLPSGHSVNKILYTYTAASPQPETGTPVSGYYKLQDVVYVACKYDEVAEAGVTYYKRSTSQTSTSSLSYGDELPRDQFEGGIPNERYYFTPIQVTKTPESLIAEGGETYYIVNTPFVRGDIPYNVGQTITPATYISLGADQWKVDMIKLLNTESASENDYINYYYCVENFEVNGVEGGYTADQLADGAHPVTYTDRRTGKDAKTGKNGGPVEDWAYMGGEYHAKSSSKDVIPAGTIIDYHDYEHLPNLQKNFVIKGMEPTERATLYVSRESDINDLSKGRIYTVIYQYTYSESGGSDADNLEQVNELHVINVYVNFDSGVPTIGPLSPPSTVLPGSTVGLKQPSVSKGAYEIQGGGWEIFTDPTDALNHVNGHDYQNNETPMYWYQDQKCWAAYYAKTYLGKTYSNPVPFSVANYHDLDAVMKDTEHHMYVDHPDVQRNSKIYIDNRDCVSDETKSELDLLKDFFDLSLVTNTSEGYTFTDGKISAVPEGANSALIGHATLNINQVGASKNLDFILQSDVSPKAYSEWTPIGDGATHCFDGYLHGDGHTITGLNNSLFNYLCGEVYNLGVRGSFTSAGIANEGYGYLENCWVKSDDKNSKTAKPLFNNPVNQTGVENPRTIHLFNCYYPEENNYTDHAADAAYGKLITEKPLKSFHNGEVAYNLNSYYLYKRYADTKHYNPEDTNNNPYGYFTLTNGTRSDALTGCYPPSSQMDGPWLLNDEKGVCVGSYVEKRFSNVDFFYAYGLPGNKKNFRAYTDAEHKTRYAPIWPDDYLYFGQMLTYGYDVANPYEELPSHIAKLNNTSDTYADYMTLYDNAKNNRVYRAPAYYRSKKMDAAYFNPYVYFAKTKKDDPTVVAYEGMTAIDFAGYNDVTVDNAAAPYQKNAIKTGSYQYMKDGAFYPPLLDDDGIKSFTNKDITQNLLVYTGAALTGTEENLTAAQKTIKVISEDDELFDVAFSETAGSGTGNYRLVAKAETSGIHGHWVPNKVATRDHLLVDKQDFNCPIAYDFADGQRMWYQRTPDLNRYVESSNSGWDAISLPFTAELVTTHQKGEITHFYQGSTKGHEYWLREFADGGSKKSDDDKVYIANMTYPAAGTGSKDYTNTFLWDYYYQYNYRDDMNTDDYQDKFYCLQDGKDYVIQYTDYPFLTAKTPYIIGFPGERYYEFDLSAKFKASTAKKDIPTPLKERETITFAAAPSNTGGNPVIRIAVSDDENGDVSQTIDGKTFTFKPNYLNNPDVTKDANGVPVMHGFPLNADGDSFVENPTATTVDVAAFRPYFEAAPDPSPAPAVTRSIMFSNISSQLGGGDEHESQDNVAESMEFYVKKHKIVVTSHMLATADVAIFNVSGMCIASFNIEPGETVETRVNNSGVYIIRAAGGHYTKKVSVK